MIINKKQTNCLKGVFLASSILYSVNASAWFWDSIVHAVDKAADTVATFTENTADDVASTVVSGYNDATHGIDTAYDAVKNVITSAASSVGSAAGSAASFCSNTMDSGYDSAMSWGGSNLWGLNENIGVNAGDQHSSLSNAWISGFMERATQKSRGSAIGYKSKVEGGTLGLHVPVSDSIMLGTAVNTSKNDTKPGGHKTGSKILTNVYSLALYGIYNYDPIVVQLHTNASKSFVTARERNILSTMSDGKYNNMSYHTEIMGSYRIKASESIAISPTLGVNYSKSDKVSYTEYNNSGGVNRGISIKASNSCSGIFGTRVRVAHDLSDANKLTSKFDAFAYYNFKPKGASTTLSVDGISFPIVHNAVKAPRLSYRLGAGLDMNVGSMEYGIGYHAQMQTKFVSHQGSIKVKVKL